MFNQMNLRYFTKKAGVIPFSATGGTITTSGAYTIHTFTSNGNFQITSGSKTCEYLVVAGGAGAGSWGGGGAGGMRTDSSSLSIGTYAVVVGANGLTQSTGTNGGNSSFNGLISTGGGGGGDFDEGVPFTENGKNGGSGGGGGASNIDTGPSSGGTGIGGQGYAGGGSDGTSKGGGGGGGAGGVGADGSGAGGVGGGSWGGGLGGVGISNSYSGSSVTYSVGGNGAYRITETPPSSYGSGGCASSSSNGVSGIVIVRYLT